MKMCKFIFCIALFFVTCVSQAGDVNAGKSKSLVCVACHGPEGISFNGIWHNLAVQKRGYIVLQLKAFREGQRYDPWMSPMAKPLSDEEIEDLAAYYSSL